MLVALLVLFFAAEAVLGVVRKNRLRAGIARNRPRFYRRSMVMWWAITVTWSLLILAEGRLTPAELGWAWPGNGYAGVPGDIVADGIWFVTGYFLLILVLGGVKARRRSRAGKPLPGRGEIDMLLPRTPTERWLAAGMAITAGITEEVIFRGLLIAAGAEIYHLPSAVAAVISLAVFTAVHLYQGKRGVIGAAVVGFVYTALFLVTGSILPGLILHAVQDLVALLLVPANAKGVEGDAGAQAEEAAPAENIAGARTPPAEDTSPAVREAAAGQTGGQLASLAPAEQAAAAPATINVTIRSPTPR